MKPSHLAVTAVSLSLSTSFFPGRVNDDAVAMDVQGSSAKTTLVAPKEKEPVLYKNHSIDGAVKVSLDVPESAVVGPLNPGGKVSERRAGALFRMNDLRLELIVIKNPRTDELPAHQITQAADAFVKAPATFDSFRIDRFPNCPQGFSGCEIEFKKNAGSLVWERELVLTSSDEKAPCAIVLRAWAHHPETKNKPLSEAERLKLYERWSSEFATVERSFSSLKAN